jgi:hypothetical protein
MRNPAQTGMGQIAESITATVLNGNDVLGLKRRDDVRFGQMAILTAAGCPGTNLLPDRLVHGRNLGAAQRESERRAFRWSSDRMSPTLT